MTKIEIYLLLAGTVACALLGYGFVVIERGNLGQTPSATVQNASPLAARPPLASPVQTRTAQAAPVAPEAEVPAAVAKLLPVNTANVPDQSLLRLCGMVNIANAANEPPKLAQWQQALPIAQKLMSCPCDCAQRNWLKHFVEMGDHALAGDEVAYNQSARLMATLGRNNAQAVALSKEVY